MPLIFHDFLNTYIGHIDGTTILGTTVRGELVLKTVDPPPGSVTVHATTLQSRDANGIRSQRCRVHVYGNSLDETHKISQALHAGVVGSGKTFPPNILTGEQTFFDHIDSEQSPVMNQSPGLKSISYIFDVVAVSRPAL